jgi:hypothetical protein
VCLKKRAKRLRGRRAFALSLVGRELVHDQWPAGRVVKRAKPGVGAHGFDVIVSGGGGGVDVKEAVAVVAAAGRAPGGSMKAFTSLARRTLRGSASEVSRAAGKVTREEGLKGALAKQVILPGWLPRLRRRFGIEEFHALSFAGRAAEDGEQERE